MIELITIYRDEISQFRAMVEEYWQELMPQSDICLDEKLRSRYFQERYRWHTNSEFPRWIVWEDTRIGFVSIKIDRKSKTSSIADVYIKPSFRRRGYGSAAVKQLLSYFDRCGIERIDLNVRRDNPAALDFWQKLGFGIAGFRLRQHRDPSSHTPCKGALSSDIDG